MNAEHAIAERPGSGTIVMRTQSDGRATRCRSATTGRGSARSCADAFSSRSSRRRMSARAPGLGLSISLGIATAHGGALTLCDTGKGACFQLTLPAFQAVSRRRPRTTGASAPSVTRADRRGRGADSGLLVAPAGTAGSYGRRSLRASATRMALIEREQLRPRAVRCHPGRRERGGLLPPDPGDQVQSWRSGSCS